MDNQLIFENENNFNIILIKPNTINHLDWFHENYTSHLTELNCYEIIIANKNNFLEIISENLNLEKFKEKKNLEVVTQVISEIPNYIYELIYIDELTDLEDTLNEIATLLNTNTNKIYGNAIIMKTFVPSLSKSILITDITILNIKEILDNRVNTNAVIYDGEWSNKIIKGNLDDFAQSFFDEDYKKFESSFLLHNINIWYEPCDGCSTKTCGKILERPIYKCLWLFFF